MQSTTLALWRPNRIAESSNHSSRDRLRARQFLLEALEPRYFLSAQIDPTFGTGGQVWAPGQVGGHTAQSWYDTSGTQAITVQPDGRIVLAADWSGRHGQGHAVIMQRLLPDGALDPSFQFQSLISDDYINEIIPQADGKLLLSLTDSDLQRLNPDGSVDESFMYHRLTSDSFQNGSIPEQVQFAWLDDVLLMPDGGILTTAEAFLSSDYSKSTLFLARYNSDGTLDPTFGQSGIRWTPLSGSTGFSAQMQSGGKLLINTCTDTEQIVWRLEPDGNLDPTFGQRGKVVIPGPRGLYFSSNDFWLQPDGRIIVGFDDSLVRLLSNGTIDPTFAQAGRAMLPPLVLPQQILSGPEGKLLIVYIDSFDLTVGLMQLNSDGKPDSSFGSNGLYAMSNAHAFSPMAAIQRDRLLILLNDGPRIDASTIDRSFHVLRIWNDCLPPVDHTGDSQADNSPTGWALPEPPDLPLLPSSSSADSVYATGPDEMEWDLDPDIWA